MVSSSGFIESGYDVRDYVLSCPEGFDIPEQCDYSDMISKVKNQGNSMKCVPYSLSYALELDHRLNGEFIKVDIDDIYNHRTNEGEGMQIRDALKYIRKNGYCGHKIKSYWKIPSSLVMKYNLLTNGPCILALPVYSDRDDFWNGSDYRGGHAIACIGYDSDGFILLNTWGPGFGYEGKCHLPYSEMNKIIEAWGMMI
jgi:hypothetical protein